MNEKQQQLYLLFRQFASQNADRLVVERGTIDFRLGSTMTFGLIGTILMYLAASLFMIQGLMLYIMANMGSLLTISLIVLMCLMSIAIVSFSGRIDLQQRMVYRYLLGFTIQKMPFKDINRIQYQSTRLLRYRTGMIFRLEDRHGKKISLVSFRKKENADLFRELLPEIFKVF